jgi:signal transduction histidine kinase
MKAGPHSAGIPRVAPPLIGETQPDAAALAQQRTVERLELLTEVTSQLLATDKPQAIVESLCRKVMKHLDCHAFFNFLLDEKTQRLRLNACAGVPPEAVREIQWLDVGVAVCGCVARDGCRIVAEDIQNTSDARTGLVKSFGIQAYACHPILNQGRVIGTLSFGSRSRPSFGPDDLSLMKAVTDQVAIAMQRLRLLESLEQRAAEAQAANVAKSQFLANISHELRTPLGAMLGMTEAALEESVPEGVRKMLQTAKDSGAVLLDLVSEILDFSRIEEGTFQLESAPFILRSFLDSACKPLAIRAGMKGLEFSCNVADDVPNRLVGDAARLRKILANLVGNAIKFTSRGRVAVRVGLRTKDQREAFLEFSVSDTGIGIAVEDQERIFAPFTQVDASMSRRYGGTGLGLAIVATLVQAMGGRTSVRSEPGRGSKFLFTVRLALDAELPPSPAVEKPAVDDVPARLLRLLVVEDTPANQKILCRILGKRGHTTELASNGREAVDLARKGRFDAILMDVQMPVLDGFGATAEIRELERDGPRTPIIAVTAHAMPGDRERCLAAGMDAYLSKPIDSQNLLELVEKLA